MTIDSIPADSDPRERLGEPAMSLPATAPLEEIMQAMTRDGAVVLLDAVDAAVLERINTQLDPLMDETLMGCQHNTDPLMQEMLGINTKRLNDTLARVPDIAEHLVAHPRVIEIVESILLEHCSSVLVQQAQVVEGHPGQTAQALHRDDGLWPVIGERFPMGVQGAFALRDSTAELGGTRVLLGSHRWPEALYYDPKKEGGWDRYSGYSGHAGDADESDVTVLETPAGSVALWYGSLLHGAGPNTTTERVRRIFIMAYTLGWLRGELNQQLMWPPAVAKKFPRKVQRLIGYQLEGLIIGGLEMGEDPIALLETS
jgi:ectoine hydroxylase-related dioxygenase (phytanoyl-CoA dioxygenase family)